MRLLTQLTLVALAVALSAVGAASARPQSFPGGVNIGIKGWGNVRPGAGFNLHRVIPCRETACPSDGLPVFASAKHVTLTAKPYKGWKFAHWTGACKRKKPKCVIDLSHSHGTAYGTHHVANVTAVFIAVAPGLTRSNPIRIGHTAPIGHNWTLRVNSYTPNLQLQPPAQAGAEYVAANVTVTYAGGGSGDVAVLQDYLEVIGSHNVTYGPYCPDGVPPPNWPPGVLYSGQSATANTCWTIATNDASSLELIIDPNFASPGPSLWFALR
jgi:hypothetical protein